MDVVFGLERRWIAQRQQHRIRWFRVARLVKRRQSGWSVSMSELDYCEKPLTGRLSTAIRCIWTLRGSVDSSEAQPIVSDGCVEIVFNLSDPFERVTAGRAHRQPLAFVVGPTALPTVVRPTGSVDVIGVRLEPWAAGSVLRMPAVLLRDQSVPLDDILPGSGLHGLREQLGTASEHERLRCLAKILESAISPIDPCGRRLVSFVRAHPPGTFGMRQLARSAGRSLRTVQRVFRDDVGLSPMTLMRIERIQRVLALLRLRPALSWGAIGAACGFYDQPHLVRDFQELVGCTPGEFRKQGDTLTTAFLETLSVMDESESLVEPPYF
jgi:AraC-like DNA-binding protein